MTWQQACDAIDQLTDADDRGDYPAIQWYERELDAEYEPDRDAFADRADFEYEMWRDQ